MRTLLALTLFASICLVSCEYCDHDSDCKLTKCGTNFRLDCYRDNVCTCIATSSSYTCSDDGSSCQASFGDCTHGDHKWHCIDSRCHCRWSG